MNDPKPFAQLTPDAVLDAVTAFGIEADGRLFALNSYENRVYQLGTQNGAMLVAKFYREGRWSDDQIREEHDFAKELAERDLAVAVPTAFAGDTLLRHERYRFALFPWMPGRAPELDTRDALVVLGRALGRMHAIGRARRFRTRPQFTIERFGDRAMQAVLESGFLPDDLVSRYEEVVEDLLAAIDREWDAAEPMQTLRLHGDCHLGNLLWAPTGPVFVDLDDCIEGPAMQDLWMLLAGDGEDQRRTWDALAEGYGQFADVDYRELRLVEPLRALRMIHFAGWLAQRWDDPAFPRAFPWFDERRYWERHLLELLEQRAVIDEPPLLSV